MSQEYSKNSLLGQLEQKGILNNSPQDGQYMPFGVLTGHIENSPFVQKEKENTENRNETKIIKKRLNDLDNNIFQEGSFLNINDEELSNEEKAAKIKLMIKKIDEKIFMLEDSDDEIFLKKLNEEKDALIHALSLLYDIEPTVKEEAKDEILLKKNFYKLENLFFKLCPIFKKKFLVHHALNKLIMLNESAKELLSKKIPYGEQEGRYSAFITYLSCANVIHSKLTKKM